MGTPSDALHIVTPTILSHPMTKVAGFNVYIKLDNLQIPGSFKIRGIGNFCKKAKARGCKKIVCASGGNAGLAAAYAAHQLNLQATIVLPKTTPGFVADKLRDFGAEVEIHGNVWDEANSYAQTLAADPECEYVHPFDHKDTWEGHETIIKEAVSQMTTPPDVVITCVGGGGLLNGIIQGMQNNGWQNIPVIAMETVGADCLNASLAADKIVTLPTITSVAKCLGALTPSSTTFEYCKKYNIISDLVTDKQAIDACLRFADDHRMLVEPACGASLAAIYSNIIQKLQSQNKLGPVKTAFLLVCGGSGVTLESLQNWKQEFGI
ncbi:hypothetical protein FSP39_025343 [Pinctada imbricata]|uniref:L-serine ammonia-lyase n=1 Tax=Pinctada imbricata TaxID=66713 RepID=A0AA88XLU3_PINIB|nr:hypothetical protein FSP39_025343 [Pinctada imbricata]